MAPMKPVTEEDLLFIEEQSIYVNTILKKLAETGKVTLTDDDVSKLDMITQTLNSFKVFLETMKALKK